MNGHEPQEQSSDFEFWGDLQPSDDKSPSPKYMGAWELVPELSLYEFGPKPESCIYEIGIGGGGIRVVISWRMHPEGAESVTEFSGRPDGSVQRVSGSPPRGAPTEFSLTHVDAQTLDSAALLDGKVVASARRVASADGNLLAIAQEGAKPDGGRYRNFQVYRRMRVEPPV
jgi:hypothetical protein